MESTEKYLRQSFFNKSKRIRKKAWKKCVESTGKDDEGNTRYSSILPLMKKIRATHQVRKSIVGGY